jgi:hypothetical protein
MFDFAPVSEQPDWKNLPLQQSEMLSCFRHTIPCYEFLWIPRDSYNQKYTWIPMDSYGFLGIALLRKLTLGGKTIVLTMSALSETRGHAWWQFKQDANREAFMDFSSLA